VEELLKTLIQKIDRLITLLEERDAPSRSSRSVTSRVTPAVTPGAARARKYREKKAQAKRDASRYASHGGSSLPLLEDSKISQEVRFEIVAPAIGEFAVFYAQYPHKVGKRAAQKAFQAARRRAPMPEIMAGLLRYAAKLDDRPWCNPATWLNQDRWADQPGPPQMGNGNPAALAEATDKLKREFMLDLHRQGLDPYEIEEAVRKDPRFGTGRTSNIEQLRPSLRVARRAQEMEGQLALPQSRPR
jgi:hypothetical protein